MCATPTSRISGTSSLCDDILKAKIVDERQMRLSTGDEDLGVIKAYCNQCLTGLMRKDGKLVCPNCGNARDSQDEHSLRIRCGLNDPENRQKDREPGIIEFVGEGHTI